MSRRPHVVGLGGTVRPGSSSERALRLAIEHAERRGASTRVFAGAELAQLPMYVPEGPPAGATALELLAHLRRADGVVVASPGYHGSVSGLVKNALDYLEGLRDDPLPYLADRAVGLVVTAHGWQAAVTTLEALRSIVHALRGWVTPYGAAINTTECRFEGTRVDESVAARLRTVADEVVRFGAAFRTPGSYGTDAWPEPAPAREAGRVVRPRAWCG